MTNLPQPFLDEISSQLDEAEFRQFIETYSLPHVTALRLNPFREQPETLAAPFIESPVPWEPFGFYTLPGVRPGLSLAHYGGAYYLQEASAMLSAMALDVTPGMKVLDLCAAPGGKSGQLLRMLDHEGLLVSNEPEPSRARMLAGNLERLGATNSIVTNEYPDKLEKTFSGFFDAVLVDAPCSGEGMFRRDPGAIEEWNPGAPEFCHQRQLVILESAAKLLRPGGQLVYSTCTFNRREDEDTITEFLSAHPDFVPEDFTLPVIGSSANGMLRAWPHRVRGEGHFVCRLRHTGTPKLAKTRPRNTDKNAQAAFSLLQKDVFGKTVPAFLNGQKLIVQGDRLFAVPEQLPALDKLRSPRPGLGLCRIGKNYVEPDHALAMALHPSLVKNSFELSDADAWRYLAGETLDCPLKGWTLVTWNRLPLGWGKASNGQLKNHLPKGLRRPQGAPTNA